MKNFSLFLSAAGFVLLPVLSHADLPAKKGEKAGRTVAAPMVAKPAPRRDHLIYYITNEKRVGSLIPMVYRRYGGRIDSASNAAVYGTTFISETGALDVGTALYKLDPSFTLGRGR